MTCVRFGLSAPTVVADVVFFSLFDCVFFSHNNNKPANIHSTQIKNKHFMFTRKISNQYPLNNTSETSNAKQHTTNKAHQTHTKTNKHGQYPANKNRQQTIEENSKNNNTHTIPQQTLCLVLCFNADSCCRQLFVVLCALLHAQRQKQPRRA